jgi:hypothetical protein
MSRLHPFELIRDAAVTEWFPALRDEAGGEREVEALLMRRPMMDLLHDLRPDEGLGDGVDDFVAFVHACYLYWCDGEHTVPLDEAATLGLVTAAGEASIGASEWAGSRYVQVHPRLLWSRLVSSDIHEPLDGWFVIPEPPALRIVACLGLHPSRPGLSVMAVKGTMPNELVRDDGSLPFAPEMEGGFAAGLRSVATAGELLSLGWHARG